MNRQLLISELNFKAVRSSGSGGQNVNKVATKVELYFDLENSTNLTEEEKVKLKELLKNKLNKDGVLMLHCSRTRSQFKNKELVITKFIELVTEGLKKRKKRVPTKIPKAVIKKRLTNKRQTAEKKASRKKPGLD